MTSLADTDAARLEAAQESCRDARCHTLHQELIAEAGVDVVLVTVPPEGRAGIVRDCPNAGKHVRGYAAGEVRTWALSFSEETSVLG